MLEHGGEGSADAAPLIKEVLVRYFNLDSNLLNEPLPKDEAPAEEQPPAEEQAPAEEQPQEQPPEDPQEQPQEQTQ